MGGQAVTPREGLTGDWGRRNSRKNLISALNSRLEKTDFEKTGLFFSLWLKALKKSPNRLWYQFIGCNLLFRDPLNLTAVSSSLLCLPPIVSLIGWIKDLGVEGPGAWFLKRQTLRVKLSEEHVQDTHCALKCTKTSHFCSYIRLNSTQKDETAHKRASNVWCMQFFSSRFQYDFYHVFIGNSTIRLCSVTPLFRQTISSKLKIALTLA